MRLGLSMYLIIALALTSSTRSSSSGRRGAGSVADARRARRPERSHTSTYVYRTVGTGPIRKTPPSAPRGSPIQRRLLHDPACTVEAARTAPWPSPRRS